MESYRWNCLVWSLVILCNSFREVIRCNLYFVILGLTVGVFFNKSSGSDILRRFAVILYIISLTGTIGTLYSVLVKPRKTIVS